LATSPLPVVRVYVISDNDHISGQVLKALDGRMPEDIIRHVGMDEVDRVAGLGSACEAAKGQVALDGSLMAVFAVQRLLYNGVRVPLKGFDEAPLNAFRCRLDRIEPEPAVAVVEPKISR
jgi:hypothetical protein